MRCSAVCSCDPRAKLERPTTVGVPRVAVEHDFEIVVLLAIRLQARRPRRRQHLEHVAFGLERRRHLPEHRHGVVLEERVEGLLLAGERGAAGRRVAPGRLDRLPQPLPDFPRLEHAADHTSAAGSGPG